MLLLIFGAGASFDHSKYAAGNPSYPRLPLANQLISPSLPRTSISRNTWPGVVNLLRRLNDNNDSDKNFNIEDALYKELEKNNDDIAGQLLSFKFYVHSVLSSAESEVRSENQADTNYSRLLDRLQGNNIDRDLGIQIVTFNYDTLIETACTQTYPSWDFMKFDDYLNGQNNIKLYKPHGSLSWQKLVRIDKYQAGSNGSLIRQRKNNIIHALRQVPDSKGDDHIRNYIEPYLNHLSEGSSYSIEHPMLALPYREKTHFVFPENHKSSLVESMRDVTHIITVGWRGAEQHFHREILSNIPQQTKVKILNVNTGGVEVETNLSQALGDRIESVVNISTGFTGFLNDPSQLEKFFAK